MKHPITYLSFILMLMLTGASCSNLSEIDGIEVAQCNDLRIVAHSKGFEEKNVSTKALKNADESLVTNMALFVFDSSDNIVDYQFVEGSKPLFTIDRDEAPYKDHTQSLLQAAKIYILANVITTGDFAAVFGSSTTSITNLAGLLALNCPVTGIDRPQIGFPMFGLKEHLDLRLKANSTLAPGAVIDITLTCLYSKIEFNISVVPEQTSEVIQKFTLDSWTVHHIPAAVKLQLPDNSAETANVSNILSDSFTRSTFSGSNPTQQGGTQLTFSFYMPEHKINGTKSAEFNGYPWGHDTLFNESRQQYKPMLLGTRADYAAYVEINGHYLDHNGKTRAVTYRVYLGEDNYENFYIRRDMQLTNNIIIKGITNSRTTDMEGTISYDHRVDVEQSNFKFMLERETLLDSHWEIRPIRIVLDANEHPDAKIQVEILNPSAANWLRMEMPSNPGGDDYCSVSSTDLAYGKRKYFTTDLVTSTLSGGTQIEITADANKAEHVIWMYIDENTALPTSDGSTTRSATVQCRYYDNGNTSSPADVTENFTFSQRSLHRITENGHTYYIEYFEEYLYNFDARDNYGGTTDGMAWGLDGVQLSSQYGAVAMDISNAEWTGGGITDVKSQVEQTINTTISNLKDQKKYDFYLPRDVDSIPNGAGNLTARERKGLDFSREIADAADIDFTGLTTNSSPNSAIEYVLNKNKRNANGSITLNSIKWYMPAIDEIEEITSGGYSSFEVFQDKLYWSSQPSYKKYNAHFDGQYSSVINILGNAEVNVDGSYYEDNINRARATKTIINGTSKENVNSATLTNREEYVWGTLNFEHSGTRFFSWSFGNVASSTTAATGTPSYDEGNCARDEIHRIRCVYYHETP